MLRKKFKYFDTKYCKTIFVFYQKNKILPMWQYDYWYCLSLKNVDVSPFCSKFGAIYQLYIVLFF